MFIGGTLIGVYDEDDDDRSARNVLVVTLAKTNRMHLGRLATAFGLTSEYVRQLRRKEERGGMQAVLGQRQGKNAKVTPETRAAWCAMFEAGRMPIDAYREQPRKDRRAYSSDRTVDRTRLSGGSATSGTRRSGDGFTTNSFEVLERGGGPSGRRRLEAKRRVGAGVRAPTWLAGEAAQVLVQAVVAS